MNSSKKYGFVWWGTAGCGSRAVSVFMTHSGCDDLYNHNEDFLVWKTGPFTHAQGIPDGLEHLPIICNTRNPYSRAVSAFLDETREEGNKEYGYSFDRWLKEIYFVEGRYPISHDEFYMTQWPKIGRNPDYIIRMEYMLEDIQKIPVFMSLPHLERGLEYVSENRFKGENPRDEYIGNIQHYQKYYNQELADLVYNNLKDYFDYFGYLKNSWVL